VVHRFLQGAIEMRERFCTAAKPHAFAQVVAAFITEPTLVALDAGFDSHSLSRNKMGDTWSDRGDDTGSFVTEDERGSQGKVAVATMDKVMEVRTTETG